MIHHNYRQSKNLKPYFKALKNEKSDFKNEPSTKKYFDHFINYIQKRNSDKPYFSMIHVSSLHFPEVFYSLEGDEGNEYEIAIAKDAFNRIDSNFKGNIRYALSVRYNDYCIEHLYNTLKEMNKVHNTVFIITSDHGTSYMYYPLREKKINNMYVENYNIPFIAFGDVDSGYSDKFYTTKDIISSVVDLAGIPANSDFTGGSIFKNESQGYAISEYLGGGCPDMSRRDIIFCIRDENYSVTYLANMNYEFEHGKLTHIFDIKDDCLEQNNIVDKINHSKVLYLIQHIENRFVEIKNQYYEICKGM